MLVMGGMLVALLSADEARDRAGFDHCADEPKIRLRLAGHDAAGGVAHVGAVEAKPNAAHHLAHVVFGEIGVCTTRAAGETVQTLGDTAQGSVAIRTRRSWMQLDDLLKGHGALLSFERSIAQRGYCARTPACLAPRAGVCYATIP